MAQELGDGGPAVEHFRDDRINLIVSSANMWCSIKLMAKVPLAPDTIFQILMDPQNHRVFRSLKEVRTRKVLQDDGHGRREVEVEQVGQWRFGPFRGSFPVTLLVSQDRRHGTIDFRLAPSKCGKGFMRDFTGSWLIQPYDRDSLEEMVEHPGRHWGPLHGAAKALHRLEARLGGKHTHESLVQLRQSVQPSIVPPPPLDGWLKRIAAAQVRTIMADLLREAERLNRETHDKERRAQEADSKDSLESHVYALIGRRRA